MRQKKIVIAFLLMLALSKVSAAGAGEADAQINELYVKSGMEKQTQQLPAVIKFGFEQASRHDPKIKNVPLDVITTMKEQIAGAFAPELIKPEIIQQIKKEMSPKDIKKVLKWLDSSLGKKCTELEKAATTPKAMKELQQFMKDIQANKPSPERLELAEQFNRAAKMTESTAKMVMNSQLAILTAFSLTVPVEMQGLFRQAIETIRNSKPQMEKMMRPQITMTILYTYQGLTNKELKKYMDFYNSKEGLKYNKTASDALSDALTRSSIRWGQSVFKILDKNKEKKKI